MLYYIKQNTNVKFILCGDYNQLQPVNDKKYDYLQSQALKEICDYNIQTLDINKRSNNEMSLLFDRIDDIKASEFGSKFTKRHICFTNKTRIKVNQQCMDIDKLKKKKAITIEANGMTPTLNKCD